MTRAYHSSSQLFEKYIRSNVAVNITFIIEGAESHRQAWINASPFKLPVDGPSLNEYEIISQLEISVVAKDVIWYGEEGWSGYPLAIGS